MSDIIDSLTAAGAPGHIPAVLEVLQFRGARTDRMSRLQAPEREKLLWWCDTRQLTLMLPEACGSSLAPDIQEEIFQRSARYSVRFERLKRDLFEITDALDAANLEFVLLKGLSHAPAMTPDARLRAQGDIDLWLPGRSVYKARELLECLGYAPLNSSKSRHLAPMARPSKWQWRGDLFDPDMPISVELHYELWSEKAEYVSAPQLDRFWERKVTRDFDGHKIYVLRDEDMLGFAALHFLLHLLHGDLPLQRAWEIARFLDMRADDGLFWKSWFDHHAPELRQLETPVYYLVTRWFGNCWPQTLDSEMLGLPHQVRRWLDKCLVSPLTREWTPNKDEVWLHLALIDGRRNKARVLFRRLVPMSLPSSAHRIRGQTSAAGKALALWRQVRFIGSRFVRHLVTLVPTIFDGLRLRWR